MSNAAIQRIIFIIQVLAAVAIAWALHKYKAFGWPSAIAIGVATGFVVHAAIILIDFVLAGIAASPTPAQHRIGVFGAIGCYVGELWASIRTFSFAQPWLANRRMAGQRIAYSTGIPVLFLHGYFCNRALWRSLAKTLASRGHASSAINLEPVFGSIDEYTTSIDHAVRRLQSRTGAPKIALVCHSMGGLAARAYLRAHGDGAIAKVITLGTPHQGTFLARFGHGKNTAQMRQVSAWREDLAASESRERRALFTVMLTHHDNIVSPQAVQVLEGAQTVEFSGMGHVAMVYEARVQAAVLQVLQSK
ncbi:MAG: esterase/lipase family protein [Burkholderiaceae bacterium]